MPTKCFMVESTEQGYIQDGEVVSIFDLRPGAMWFEDHNGKTKKMLYAVCPNGTHWNIDPPGHEWKRVGTPPELTITPSIRAVSSDVKEYHGWVRDGYFTDDVNGNTY